MDAVTAPRIARASRRRFRLRSSAEPLILLIALVVAVVMLYPTVWVFFASFKTQETLFSAEFADYTLRNYIRLFDSGFGVHIANSLLICGAAVVISTFVSVIAAYVFSRKRFPWKSAIFGAVMLGQTFPWIILVTPVFILFARLGLLNSYTGMVFCYVAVTIPFSVYLLVGYLESVPRSLDETAIIDGCPPFQVIWRIVFPIMLPGVVATATYAFLLCWSEYLFALAFLTRTDMKTMPLALYAFFGEHTTEWGQVMAASALTTLPTLLLFLPLQTKLLPAWPPGLSSSSPGGRPRPGRSEGNGLPRFVEHEFRDFLGCGVLAEGFTRLRWTGANVSYALDTTPPPRPRWDAH